MFDLRRRQAQTDDRDGSSQPIAEDDLNQLLSELVADGNVIMQDLDEDDDAEYQPGEDEDEEDIDEDMEADELDEDEEEDDEDMIFGYMAAHSIPGKRWHEEVKEPKEAGMSLLFSGEFGRIRHQIKSRNKDGSAAKFWLNSRSKLRPTYREDAACVRRLLYMLGKY